MRDPIWPPPITQNIIIQKFPSFSSSSFGCLKNVFKKPYYGETIALDLRFIFGRGHISIWENPGEILTLQKHHFYYKIVFFRKNHPFNVKISPMFILKKCSGQFFTPYMTYPGSKIEKIGGLQYGLYSISSCSQIIKLLRSFNLKWFINAI